MSKATKEPSTIDSLAMLERETRAAVDAARIASSSAQFALKKALETLPVPHAWKLGTSDEVTWWERDVGGRKRAIVKVVWGGYRAPGSGLFLYWHPGQSCRDDHQHTNSLEEAMRLALSKPKRKAKR